MLNQIIKSKTNLWLQSEDCSIKETIKYIRNKGELRDTQIEAIETYLFLKIKSENKPLWKLFSEGFFTNGSDLSKLNINETAKDYLKNHKEAHALYDFSVQNKDGQEILPNLKKLIISDPDKLDYEKIIKSIFYDIDYPDYLMSLPMGAGKTFLMAAIIYLNLYYAQNEPENKHFAHNFLVMIPSGLKSSIGPSLRNIANFDPTWVLPEPAASKIKRLIKFDVLDQPRSAKKSNKVENPNAQKVSSCLHDPFARVFVVNAEKVILNRVYLDDQQHLFEKTEDEKDRYANELRHVISKMPNLSIFIDEVHHATDSDIKLRQVVNDWNQTGNITTVLGFSGTPYLQSADKILITENEYIRFSQITNTVYYYPLITAIKSFLKVPKVKIAENLSKLQIIEKGVRDFQKTYGDRVYENGNIAKLAIYCGNIDPLEEEVYPFLTGSLNISQEEILKNHDGNKNHKIPKENKLLFNSLDIPGTEASKTKRYILLAQIGKEGWDCRSLTGVILSQKGDCPTNMVLQTSCRCLRQVEKDKDETAVIWLNEYNAKTLNGQLKKEQDTSIEDINSLGKSPALETVSRYSRMEHLKLPEIEFCQLKVNYTSIDQEDNPNTANKLKTLLINIEQYRSTALIRTGEIENIDQATRDFISETGRQTANLNHWLFDISKESFHQVLVSDLDQHLKILNSIFDKITYWKEHQLFLNDLYDIYRINSQIRLAFSIKRELQTQSEVIPEKAELLIVDKLSDGEKNDKLYPNADITGQILEYDQGMIDIAVLDQKLADEHEKAKQILINGGLANMVVSLNKPQTLPIEIKLKDSTFHYIPYDFHQSGFEKNIIENILTLDAFRNRNLEIYYNGARGLTEFEINCFVKANKYWKNIGKYTPDFLIITRKNEEIHKALIIETKGEGFAYKPDFVRKKKFVETSFLEQNKAKFGYQKFDFLYLPDSDAL
ncbi:MAG: DEAD/DEAH box helicase family protein, partial [Candidatus Marinimicrobia bacterium]|nr:DEAD/DEAH box helicase family protein [Candidatus Neomarinimicrobiota bacterium]